jgi:hypothetical protein
VVSAIKTATASAKPRLIVHPPRQWKILEPVKVKLDRFHRLLHGYAEPVTQMLRSRAAFLTGKHMDRA